MLASSQRSVVSISLARPFLVAAALVTALQAQSGASATVCGQMPNECCPPPPVNEFSDVVAGAVSAINSVFSQFFTSNGILGMTGPASATMWNPGTTGVGLENRCKPDRNRELTVVGGGNTVVTVHGCAERYVDMAVLPTGVSGMAGLYGSVLVVGHPRRVAGRSATDRAHSRIGLGRRSTAGTER